MIKNNKSFILYTILILAAAMLVSTFVLASVKPQLHKTLMFELINVKIKK